MEELPCLSNAMLIGDRRKFLSCLLTLKVDVDADTLEPTNKLASAAVDWCKEIGSKAKTVEEAISDPAVTRALQGSIDRVNANATSNAQVKFKFQSVNFGGKFKFINCFCSGYRSGASSPWTFPCPAASWARR